MDRVIYCNYRFEIHSHGPGFKIFIYAPNSKLCFEEIPNSMELSSRSSLVAKARALVDKDIERLK